MMATKQNSSNLIVMGNNVKFSTWFNENYPMLASTSMLIAFDRTIGLDAINNAFEKLFINWNRFDDATKPAKPEHWALRRAIAYTKQHEKELDIQTIDLMVEEILSSFAANAKEPNLSSQLKAMDVNTRAIVVLNKFLGFAISDISYIVRVDKTTVEDGMDAI